MLRRTYHRFSPPSFFLLPIGRWRRPAPGDVAFWLASILLRHWSEWAPGLFPPLIAWHPGHPNVALWAPWASMSRSVFFPFELAHRLMALVGAAPDLCGIPITSLMISFSYRFLLLQSPDLSSPESPIRCQRSIEHSCFSHQAISRICNWSSFGSVNHLLLVLPTPARRTGRILDVVACHAIAQMVSVRLAVSDIWK